MCVHVCLHACVHPTDCPQHHIEHDDGWCAGAVVCSTGKPPCLQARRRQQPRHQPPRNTGHAFQRHRRSGCRLERSTRCAWVNVLSYTLCLHQFNACYVRGINGSISWVYRVPRALVLQIGGAAVFIHASSYMQNNNHSVANSEGPQYSLLSPTVLQKTLCTAFISFLNFHFHPVFPLLPYFRSLLPYLSLTMSTCLSYLVYGCLGYSRHRHVLLCCRHPLTLSLMPVLSSSIDIVPHACAVVIH